MFFDVTQVVDTYVKNVIYGNVSYTTTQYFIINFTKSFF